MVWLDWSGLRSSCCAHAAASCGCTLNQVHTNSFTGLVKFGWFGLGCVIDSIWSDPMQPNQILIFSLIDLTFYFKEFTEMNQFNKFKMCKGVYRHSESMSKLSHCIQEGATSNLSYKCPEVIFHDLRVFLHVDLI